MVRSTSIIRYMKRAIFPALCTFVVAYFAYHAVNGSRGLIAWYSLQQEAVILEQELARLQSERQVLEQRVALMQPESLDPDMLDERARQILNLAHPDEITILFSEPRD